MKSEKITKKILHHQNQSIPLSPFSKGDAHLANFFATLHLERSEILYRVFEVGNCITITGFSFFPVVSRFLRKMLFVGVCQLFPEELFYHGAKLTS